ncbi:MAG: TorF family putative porin [Hyphomonadaceae bacterium]
MLEPLVVSGAAACAAGAGESPPPPPPHFQVSAELVLVSDYRRNGVTQSRGDPAIQGRIDIRHDSGFSVGAFATSMHARKGSNAQLALFGAKRIELGETTLSLGASTVFFFGGDADPFSIAQASVSRPFGPIDATLAVNYAPAQESLNDQHGANVNLRARTPLGRLNGAPLTASASVGWSEGEFAMGAETKLDWSVGVSADVAGVELGLAYVDNDLDDDRGDAGLVFSIARRF